MAIYYNKMGTEENPYNLHYYNAEDFKIFIIEYLSYASVVSVKRKNKRDYDLLDTIVSFDIETTSTRIPREKAFEYDNVFKWMYKPPTSKEEADIEERKGVKFAFVYVWQIAFGKEVWIGRSIFEFKEMVDIIKLLLIKTMPMARLIIWIQNYSFEWCFIKTFFNWEDYLFVKPSKILYAVTDNIEFRCTYMLSGLSLDDMSKELINKMYAKKTGDIDYNIPRVPMTPLTKEELEYCIYDVLSVNEYLIEYLQINNLENFKQMPYTKTGKVRNKLKANTINNKNKEVSLHYSDIMKKARMSTDEYKMLKDSFQGGFTHANPNKVNKVCKVKAYDINSSYPYVITTQKFPKGQGTYFVNDDLDLGRYIKTHGYAWVFVVIFTKVESKFNFDHFWSVSKTDGVTLSGEVVDNGRLVKCDYMKTVMTDIDYDMFCQCYNFESDFVVCGYKYEYDYLPKEFILTVLDFYKNKTELKGIDGKEYLYNSYKVDVNGCYGVCGQDPIKPAILLDKDLNTYIVNFDDESLNAAIKGYNNKFGRFTSYAWAPWVTAYARYRIWELILMDGEAHVYTDTDSEKADSNSNIDENVKFLNDKVYKQIDRASFDLDIPIEYYKPKTKKGKEKVLGLWDYEGEFELKTLGAKRYMTRNLNPKDPSDEWTMTVAGVNKKKSMKWILQSAKAQGISPFEEFRPNYYFPAEAEVDIQHSDSTPNSLHRAVVRDYLGNEQEVYSPSWRHLEAHSYSMNFFKEYEAFLNSKDFEFAAKS